MNRLLMVAAVILAAYALLDIALSIVVAIVWRTRAVAPANVPPAVRARRLIVLRLTPTMIAALVTLVVVAPAFVIYEPDGLDETMGPVLAMLAIAALLQFAAALAAAVRGLVATAAIERAWLRDASPMALDAMPAFIVEMEPPIVALVGVFSPKLLAARAIVDACSADEINRIAGHELGHLQSRDNLMRWIMSALPDMLRWTRSHDEIVEAWHDAAEDAADDATTGGEAVARAELAGLLVKVARLVSPSNWRSAIVSAFVERDALERRVRRLIQPEIEPPAPLAIVPIVMLATIVIATIATASSLAALQQIWEAFEGLVAFGR